MSECCEDCECDGGACCAAYWLEEKGKDKVRECSGLLKAALDILQQYRAAPELQADIAAAHEARSSPAVKNTPSRITGHGYVVRNRKGGFINGSHLFGYWYMCLAGSADMCSMMPGCSAAVICA